MTIVKYFFDKQKDIQNIWKAANLKNKLADFSRNIKPELLYLSLNKGLSESEADIEKFNKQIYDSEIIQTFPGLLDDAWDTIEYSYFLRLQRITGKQFIRKQVLGFVTTIQKCPYNPEEGWFMTCLFDSIPGCMLTTAHEIFHLHIHDHFFEAIKNVVGEEKAHDIKEAVTTTLLNLEFRDLWSLSDKGYEKHAELRRFIEEQWKKEKDFYSLLEKCVLKLRKSD